MLFDIFFINFVHLNTSLMCRILVVCDKFKGSLTSSEAGEAVRAVIAAAGADVDVLPVADGGEGTEAIMAGEQYVSTAASGEYGLPLIQRTSRNVGRRLREAVATGRHVYIGVGGTNTADGGAGMLAELGFRFYDGAGMPIEDPAPERISQSLVRIEVPEIQLSKCITALCDVRATLCGPGLSALDFIVQKGAQPGDEEIIASALMRLKNVCGPEGLYAGAGGGIGYALESVLGVRCVSGADFMLGRSLAGYGKAPDLIITGEGRVDAQTGGGKLVDTVVRYGAAHGIPVVIFAGKVDPATSYRYAFGCVAPQDPIPENPGRALGDLVRRHIDLVFKLAKYTKQ